MREEPGVYPVEGLLRDEPGGTLGLEAAVDALHLGHGKAENWKKSGKSKVAEEYSLKCPKYDHH